MGAGGSAAVSASVSAASESDLIEALGNLTGENLQKLNDAMASVEKQPSVVGWYEWTGGDWNGRECLRLNADGTAEFYKQEDADADVAYVPCGNSYWGTGTWVQTNASVKVTGKGFEKKFGYSYKKSEEAQNAEPEDYEHCVEISSERLTAGYKDIPENGQSLKDLVDAKIWGKGTLPSRCL
eukprot:TRINITY_DN10099_c0_g1_i2.p1 TRINITY_DN10099_c0_g1~~TRINITY_DN10099_c0_g1_i2.p1  ORF type:complete len:182 (+),score=37.75 TRINITY_DN10099_c0_g1_i2:83-628(+)